MNVVIDWGNSSLKVGWFSGTELLETGQYETPVALHRALAKHRAVMQHGIASSTSRPADELRDMLKQAGVADFRILNAQTPVPIGNAYDTPHTLGADRLAAAVGANSLFGRQPCLIFDLGTCLTADFVDGSGVFRGGLIAPGLAMRLRAMHEFTRRLPLVPLDTENVSLTATNTRQAMLSGAVNGLQFELSGILETYRAEWPDLRVLLCGGDAPTFESRLKEPIFAVPELVLIGLNTILRYNVDIAETN